MTTTAEEYGRYVDAVIPLGFRIADETTKLKEFAIYMTLAGEAQKRLSAATDAIVAFTRLMPHVVDEATLTGPSGAIDAPALLTQLFVSSQLVHLRGEAEAAIAVSDRISVDLETADQHAFDRYTIATLRVQLEGAHVELMDGVYIVGCDLISLGISLAISIFQALSNAEEQREIERHNERLAHESVKDVDMQRFARQHSARFKDIFRASFDHYQRLADGFRTWLGTHTPAQIEARHGRLLALAAQLEHQFVEELESAAIAAVRASQGAEDEAEERLKLSVRANLRVTQNLVGLEHVVKGELSTAAGKLEADLRLAKLMGLDSVLAREPQVRQAIRRKREACLAEELPEPASTFALKALEFGYCIYAGGYAFGTFCENLHATGGPPGVSTNGHAGYCQSSATLAYSTCGGGVPMGGSWDGIRSIVAAQGGLPGSYSARRAEAAAEKFEASRRFLSQHVNDLTEIGAQLVTENAAYTLNNIVPSVDATLRTLQQATADVSVALVPVLSGPAPGLPVPGTPGPTPLALSSSSIRDREARISAYAGPPMGMWDLLAPIQFVGVAGAQHLPVPDRRALLELYGKYFGENGVARPSVLAVQFASAGQELAALYKTEADSFEGAALRAELNRGLFALSGPLPQTSKLAVAGGLAMISAADMAIAVGDRSSADRLAAIGAGVIDFALGLTPAAPINDAAQILHGVLTGKDYAGNAMAASDYALRAMGVAIGVIPLGRPALSLGGTLVTEAVVHGAELIKRMNARGRLLELVGDARQLLRSFTEFVGDSLHRALIETMSPQDVAAKLHRILLFEGHLLETESRAWVLGAWDKLRLEGRALDDGLVKHFDARPFTRIEIPADGKYARVVPRSVAGDILAGTAPLSRNALGEAFITAAADLEGLTTGGQIARRLSLFTDAAGTTLARLDDHVVLEFRLSREPLVSPVNFDLPHLREAGWIYGGMTQGGSREWILDARASMRGLLEFVGQPRPITP